MNFTSSTSEHLAGKHGPAFRDLLVYIDFCVFLNFLSYTREPIKETLQYVFIAGVNAHFGFSNKQQSAPLLLG